MNRFMVAAAREAHPARGASPLPSLMGLFPLILAILVLARHLSWNRRAREKTPEPVEAGLNADILPTQDVNILERSEPTAVFLVGGGAEQDPQALRAFAGTFSRQYKQVLFLAVGVVDAPAADSSLPSSENFGRSAEAKALRRFTRLALDPHLEAAHRLGLQADCRISIAVNPAREMGRLIDGVVRNFPRVMFFVGKPVYEHARWYERALRSASADSIRGFLEKRGVPVTVVPVLIAEDSMSAVERN